MNVTLRVLMVEDSIADAQLELIELRRGGYEPIYERVDTPSAMKEALEEKTWDVILSDYMMPGFSGPAALKLVRERGVDIPIIMVTGQVGEATAIETLTAGANDYVMKSNMARLVPAIQRVLKDSELRRGRQRAESQRDQLLEELQAAHDELEQRVKERTMELARTNHELRCEAAERARTEEALKESEEKYRGLFTNISNGYAFCEIVLDEQGEPTDFVYLEVNDNFETLTGLAREDVIGKKVTEAIPGIKEGNPEIIRIYGEVALTGTPAFFEVFFEPLGIWLTISVYSPKEGFFVAVFDNITERKRAEGEREELLKEVEKQRNLFQMVVENAPDGIAVLQGDDLVYQIVNPVYRAFASGKQIQGKAFSEVWPEAAEAHLPLLKRVLATGEPVFGAEQLIPIRRSPDGPLENRYWTYSYLRLPTDRTGQPRVLSWVTETTEIVRARQRAEP